MRDDLPRPLRELARLHGVQTSYRDAHGLHRSASPEALMAVLRALGAPVARPEDAPAATAEQRAAFWTRVIEPVVVAWDGRGVLDIRTPAGAAGGRVTLRLESEAREAREWTAELGGVPVRRAAVVGGVRHESRRLPLPAALAPGYYALTLQAGGAARGALVISAPRRAYPPHGDESAREWGVFLPLYALHSDRSWGAGDFTDLGALATWMRGLGGRVLATLPLLAAYLDEPCDPAPYIPASRLFWNEFYVDPARAPEFAACPGASGIVSSDAFQAEVRSLRDARFVDYRRQMALKRAVLERMARRLFEGPSARRDALGAFVAARPEVEDYARFRATGERHRETWPRWPGRQRAGNVRPGDYDEEASRYHLYVQWLAEEQVASLDGVDRDGGAALYLDLPLGVHGESFDVWRHRDAFVEGVSGGAPPDLMFTGGQDWGIPPLHPQRTRELGHRYTIAYLRHHMRHAGLLRVDHVMGLHRLYWTPRGMSAADGLYVRYPANELYAILCLESRRHRCGLVGENLGIVPWYVNEALAGHGMQSMHVMQYALSPDPQGRPAVPAVDSVASLNTHDIFPFEGFRLARDVDDRLDLRLLDEEGARRERGWREGLMRALAAFLEREGRLRGRVEEGALVRGCLEHLAAGPARTVLVNLEDLWLETDPQNVPGTWQERPNWLRRARRSFEAFRDAPDVVGPLREVNRLLRHHEDR